MEDILKIDDLGDFLASVKAGGALRKIEIAPSAWARFVSPALFVFAVANHVVSLPTGQQHMNWWEYVLLPIYAASLVAMVANMQTKLRVSTLGIEIWSGFKCRVYRFTDMKEPFTLAQRKVMPGFDIVVPVAGAAAVETPVKLVPPRRDIVDTQLIELLNMYRDGAVGV